MLPDKLTCKMAMKREMASDGGDGGLSELLMSREFFAWYRVMQHIWKKDATLLLHIILPYANQFLWSPYVIGQTIIFSSCFFFLASFFFFLFFSSPNLSGRRLDVYHTLAHGVALVRI